MDDRPPKGAVEAFNDSIGLELVDADDAGIGLNPGAHRGARVAIGALNVEFDQIASGEEAGEKTGFADLERGFAGLAVTAEAGFVHAGERMVSMCKGTR